MIHSQCPYCKMEYELQDIDIWKQAKCKTCQNIFTIEVSQINNKTEERQNKRWILVFLSLTLIITTLYWGGILIDWNRDRKRTTTLNTPVDLWECKTFTENLISCKASTCKYSRYDIYWEQEISTTNTVIWTENNCSHSQEIYMGWKLYSVQQCDWLNSLELNDLAHDYSIQMGSNWSSYSAEVGLNWSSKITIDGKVLKNTSEILRNNGKCTLKFPWVKGFE